MDEDLPLLQASAFFTYSALAIESFTTLYLIKKFFTTPYNVTAGFLKGNSLRRVERVTYANCYGLCSFSQYAQYDAPFIYTLYDGLFK